MYETLAVLNEETGAIDPVLLESMELVDDVTVRIVIKEGIQFHNGEILTAPGLAKSFELLRDADPQKFTWSFRQLNDYESYEVIDDYTMEFTLIEPIDRWANLFANHMPLAPDHLEAVGLDGYIEEPVGTGPYKFSSWQRDSYITLERWEDHPDGLSVIEKVTFRHMPEAAVRVAALKSGEIHIAAHVPPDQIESLTADGFELYAGDSMQSMYVGINIYGRNEILNDVRVRQAMLYSVDLDGMWNTIAGGFGTKLDCQIVAPGGFGYNPDVQTYPYDPEKAKALLTEARLPRRLHHHRLRHHRPLLPRPHLHGCPRRPVGPGRHHRRDGVPRVLRLAAGTDRPDPAADHEHRPQLVPRRQHDLHVGPRRRQRPRSRFP